MGYRMRKKPASMRVAKTKEIEKKEIRTCGECALGEWNMENRNYKGEPFIGYCEHAKFGHSKDDRGVFLDDTPACLFFEAGMKRKGAAK